jgi:hypothetical protein
MLSRTTLDQASVSVLTSRAQVYSGLLSNQLTGLVEESNNPDPSREIVIVASAGNNTLKAKSTDTFPPRAQTNAPASFKSVYGVGALNQNFSLTPYSSEPDSGNPVNNIYDPGFAIFGGEVTEPINFPNNKPLLITDMDKGILGLCITDFVTALNGSTDPAEWSWQFNQYGWGRWAGASFATGVMSGIVALLASNGYWQSNPPTTSSTDRAYIKVIERIVQLLQDPTSPNPPTKPYIIKIHQA